MKKCRKCGEEKQFLDFGSEKRVKSGLRAICKSCVTVRNKAAWAENKYPRSRNKEQEAIWSRKKRAEPGFFDRTAAKRMATRRAVKRMAIMPWRNQFFIDEIYDLAVRRTKTTGFQWHVDHIVPLNHPLVCGLHVEHNLQVIPGVDNCRKQNKFSVDSHNELLA
jgi:hypothetical protein